MNRLALLLVLAACASNPAPTPPPTSSPVVDAAAPEASDAGSASAPPIEDASVAATSSATPVSYPTAPDDTDAMILRREACHGQCPIYTLGITSNGNVHFWGAMFTKQRGYAFDKITKDQVAALYKFMEKHPVAAENRKYPRRPDSASAYVVIQKKGVSRRVDPPGEIADEIDRVVGSAKWTAGFTGSDAHPNDSIPAPALEAMLGTQRKALDKCATKPDAELEMSFHIDELGHMKTDGTRGKNVDPDCAKKAIGAFRFPLADANADQLTLAVTGKR